MLRGNSSASHSDYLSAYHQNMSTHSFHNLPQHNPVPPYGPYQGMTNSVSSRNSQHQPHPISSPPSAPHLPALAIPDPELIPLPSPPPSIYSAEHQSTSPPRPTQQYNSQQFNNSQQFSNPFKDPPSRASNVPAPLHIRPPGAVRARVSFKPTANDELAVNKGEDVQVLRRFSDGWAEVKSLSTGRTGVIPMQILDDQPTTPMSYNGSGSSSSIPGSSSYAPSINQQFPSNQIPSAPPSNFNQNYDQRTSMAAPPSQHFY